MRERGTGDTENCEGDEGKVGMGKREEWKVGMGKGEVRKKWVCAKEKWESSVRVR